MNTFKTIRCSRKAISGGVVATCAGLPGKRKIHHSPTGYETDGLIAAADSQRDLDASWAGMHSADCLCDACERVRFAYTGENS